MHIGYGFDRLEQRITSALCSGSLRFKEAEFLQQISRKIGLYRERTLLSDAQARWLFTILTSFKNETVSSPASAKASSQFERKDSSPQNLVRHS